MSDQHVTVDDALARLTAGVDEDERIEQAADTLGQLAETITTSTCQEFADHIARHDPARERHEVALKRLILREHKPLTGYGDGTYVSIWTDGVRHKIRACEACSTRTGPANDAEDEYEPWPCNYIRALEDIYREGL